MYVYIHISFNPQNSEKCGSLGCQGDNQAGFLAMLCVFGQRARDSKRIVELTQYGTQ